MVTLEQHLIELDSEIYSATGFQLRNQIEMGPNFLMVQNCIYLASKTIDSNVSGRVFSLDALDRGLGWKCDLNCQRVQVQHFIGILFIPPHSWSSLSMLVLNKMGKVNCPLAMKLYIIDQSWLSKKLDWVYGKYILEILDPHLVI